MARPPDIRRGLSVLHYGTDSSGHKVLIRSWPRLQTNADDDLEALWFHELRQLRRLSGYTNGADELVTLSNAGIDDDGYHLTCLIGRRRLLSDWLEATPSLWQSRTSASDRALLWRNLARIAQALSVLHAQGRTHRNIDA
jgi:hypothetical protein